MIDISPVLMQFEIGQVSRSWDTARGVMWTSHLFCMICHYFFFYYFRTANTDIAVTTANNYLNMEHPDEFGISDSHGFVEICDMPLDNDRRKVFHFERSAIQLLPFMNFALKKKTSFSR